MNSKEKNITLKKAYFKAFLIMVVALVIGYAGIQALISGKRYGPLIDISSNQLYLSQRIAFFASLLEHEERLQRRLEIRESIIHLKNEMARNHRILLNGNSSLNIPPTQDEDILNIYFKAPYDLDQNIKNFLEATERLLHKSYYVLLKDGQMELEKITAEIEHGSMIEGLETLSHKYLEKSQNQIKRTKLLIIGFIAYVVIILILEILFIFIPMNKKLNKSQRRILHNMNALNEKKINAEEKNWLIATELKSSIQKLYTSINVMKDKSQRNYDITLDINILNDEIDELNTNLDLIIKGDDFTITDTKINLKELLSGIEQNFKSKYKSSNKELNIEYQTDFPTLKSKENVLLQLFNYLIDNSIKHNTNDSTQILVNAHIDEVNNNLVVSLKDNGTGLSETQKTIINKIFQNGYINGQEKEHASLINCQKLIEIVGGRIWVTATENKGSTFFISLPQYEKETNHDKDDEELTKI